MSDRKRKISIRKVIQTLLTLVVVAGFTMAFVSADRMQNNKKIRNVSVRIRNANTVHFLDEAEVMKLLFSDLHLDPKQTTLARLDIKKMEQAARSNPWVSDAQVYVDNERDMHVSVTQRVPVVRIFEANGNSYYLDTSLQSMPLSEHYVHYTPVVTGTPVLHDDSAGRELKGKIVGLVERVANNKFWNAQIAQIVVTPEQSFELIPVLGKQRIVLGDTTHLGDKLSNLLAFYQQVQNKVGWEKYEVIDLRFEDQVVASPSLPWKAPVDRALSNMNWVKAVMEAGPKNDRDESVTNAGDSAAVTPAPVAAIAPKPVAAPKPVTPKPAAAAQPKPAKPATGRNIQQAAAKPGAKPVKPVKSEHKKDDKKKDDKKKDNQKKVNERKKETGRTAAANTPVKPKPKPKPHQTPARHN